jgi:hypothetical protein
VQSFATAGAPDHDASLFSPITSTTNNTTATTSRRTDHRLDPRRPRAGAAFSIIAHAEMP